MQSVLIIDNPLDRETWEEVEVEDVRALLTTRFSTWPASGRIYARSVCVPNDVTPHNQAEVARLADFDRLVVVIYPEDPVTIITTIIIVVLVALGSFLLLPKINPNNVQNTSPNNGLSERTNRARPGARIPDIFGQVRSIPDLIARPYRVYDDHRQLEIAYMCVGRGAYEISDIRDPVFSVTRLNDVNGQTLKAPNDTSVRADQEIKFKDGGIIEVSGGGIDFTDYFEPDDEIDLGNTDTSALTPPVAIFVSAVASMVSGNPGKFVFSAYDPTSDFEAGMKVKVGQAVWVTTTGGGGGGDLTGGGVGGGEDNPDYPNDIFFPPPIVGD